MATNLQRAQSNVDSLINNSAPLSLLARIGRAFAWRNGTLVEYDAMTTAQKAGFYIAEQRRAVIRLLQDYDAYEAQQAAIVNANAAVLTELAETP